jgi:sugar lactone lactonase YvrE
MFGLVGATLALIIGGLIAFSPIDPVAWTPPDAQSVAPRCDDTAPDVGARVLASGLPGTPDGIIPSADGGLHAALSTGRIARIDPIDGSFSIVGEITGARLTGLAAAPDGAIYAADEVGGAVYRFDVGPSSPVRGQAVLRAANGRALQWTNDITAAPDGAIYVTTSSQRRTLDQFFHEVLEHRGSGQLIRLDPRTNDVRVLQSSLNMTNGAAADSSGGVLVAESSSYSVRRFGFNGAPGEIVAGSLPGFPGNIRASDRPGVYWLTLLSPRSALIDQLAGVPWARRLMAWLPETIRPRPQPFHCVVRITLGPSAPRLEAFRVTGPSDMPSFSTALEVDGKLYVSPAGLGGVERGEIYVIDSPGASQ